MMHGRKDLRSTKFRNSNRVQKRTNERTSLERVGPAVGASLSQSHQTTVIATGATSHRALDAQANTITPSFGALPFSLFLSAFLVLVLLFCRLHVLLSDSPSFFNLKPGPPDVSIARLHAPPRCWITRRRECYRQVINPRARKENEFNDPELSHRLLP